jgi:hypothetical protein
LNVGQWTAVNHEGRKWRYEMTTTSSTARLCLVTLALAGLTFLAAPEAHAVTYGEPDCIDNATNTGCLHPNVVIVGTFRWEGRRYRVVSRCSGSLLAENEDRFIILTAGHCASSFLYRSQNFGETVGVSFDAEIVRDLPRIGPAAWTPRQFILGGQPVLAIDYGPTGKTGIIQFDYAVIVFDIPESQRFKADPRGHPTGEWVDLSEIAPVTLPEQDYLADKVSGNDPLMVTTVGYGNSQLLNGPGEGGNPGGLADVPTDRFGVRWMTEYTSAFALMGREQHLFNGSENPARGHAGSCFYDSGGPLFYTDEGVEIQIGITSSGDNTCRATGVNVRTDGARIVEFLDCVTAPDAQLEDILACGCTEINEKRVCP